jgi:hypothetical protein
MTNSNQPASDGGTVYLLHLDPPLKHARHYTGWTSDLDRRLAAHRAGRGARLMEVVKEAGGTFRLVRTWAGSRVLERTIKDLHNAPRLCPECTPEPQPVTRTRVAPANPKPGAAPEAVPDVVPEPDPNAWLMPFGRPAGPETYAEALPITDRLISAWRAEADGAVGLPAPEPEAELELEPLPPVRQHARQSAQPEGTAHGHLQQPPRGRR